MNGKNYPKTVDIIYKCPDSYYDDWKGTDTFKASAA